MVYFVTAIGTDSGKTLVSSILCEAMQADYWKPVQAGLPRDADQVKNLVSNNRTVIHPGRWELRTPASPHAAARIDGITITLDDFSLPNTDNTLIIEGAGGALVPLNDNNFVIDVASKFQIPVILVANLYLGSINHTLLTAEALRNRKLKVEGVVFNGPSNEESERIIIHHTGYKVLLNIPQESSIDQSKVRFYAQRFNENRK